MKRDFDVYIYPINEPIKSHLKSVVEYMEKHGSPTIRVYEYDSGIYYALEGSHRLAAAKILNMVPVLLVMDLEDSVEDFVDVDRWDLLDNMVGYNEDDFDPDRHRTVEDIVNYVQENGPRPIKFEEVHLL